MKKGFVSTYASKEPNEDFVELIAEYVTDTDEKWNKMLESSGDEGKLIDKLRAALQSKVEKLNELDLDNIEIKKQIN